MSESERKGKFLTKAQEEELRKHDWELIDNDTGLFWFGCDWDTKLHPLEIIGDTIELDQDAKGYNFFVVAIAKNVETNEEEETDVDQQLKDLEEQEADVKLGGSNE